MCMCRFEFSSCSSRFACAFLSSTLLSSSLSSGAPRFLPRFPRTCASSGFFLCPVIYEHIRSDRPLLLSLSLPQSMCRNHAYPTKKMSTTVVVQLSVNWNTCQSLVYVELCAFVRNKSPSRERKLPTLLSVHSCKHGRRGGGKARRRPTRLLSRPTYHPHGCASESCVWRHLCGLCWFISFWQSTRHRGRHARSGHGILQPMRMVLLGWRTRIDSRNGCEQR